MDGQADKRRKLRMGMIGGGRGSFIGDIHRRAVALCGDIELVCGAFSSDPDVSRQSGADLYLEKDRTYVTFEEMVAAEAQRDVADRPDFFTIVTPNHLHAPAASVCLENGFHVMCDKPLTRTLDEAYTLRKLAESTGQYIGVSYAYLGYPLLSQARQMIARGELGAIRKVFVEYPQGWLSAAEELSGNPQAGWRTDPDRSGISGCIGDIGTHAHALAEFVTGQAISEVCAELTTFVTGRRLDDDGSALFRMSAGAKGVLSASQVCTGAENGLRIAVFGSEGGIEWRQQEPNSLILLRPGQPVGTYRAGADVTYLDPNVRSMFITPSGHPEGFIEAFANVYQAFATRLRRGIDGAPASPATFDALDINVGVRGMEFIAAMVSSSQRGGVWTRLSGETVTEPVVNESCSGLFSGIGA